MPAPRAPRSLTASPRKPFGFARGLAAVPLSAWSFVYVFFSNGTPFDAPNRSETCRPA